MCAGTVIEKHWILTSATCCKHDDIVTIKFNDYSGLFQTYELGSNIFFRVKSDRTRTIKKLQNLEPDQDRENFPNLGPDQAVGGPWIPDVNLKLLKVFYAEEDEHDIISTLFYIHKDLDACLIRTAEDISNTIDQTPCIKKVRFQHSKTNNI